MSIIQSLLPAIEHFHVMGYWIALFVVLLETIIGIGLFVPGSTIVLFMGALAARGYFDLGDLLWFAIIGAVLGDNVNYFIGRKYGSRIFAKGLWFIKPAHFEKGREFFEKHGAKSVFFGRFVPSIKEVIPLVAGMLGMKRAPFMVWNVFGAIGWSLLWILPGYFFAQSLDLARMWLTRAGFFLLVIFILFIILYVLDIVLAKKGRDFFSSFSLAWRTMVESSGMQKFINRHEKLFHFVQRRLDKKNFFGLPFTLFFLALIYAIFLFGGVIEDLVTSNFIVSSDIQVANTIDFFRNTEFVKIFFWITLLGKWQTVTFFIIITILTFWTWEKRFLIIPILVCVSGSELFVFFGKLFFHRARPDGAVFQEDSFSFPSGHATIAVAFYGFITYVAIKYLKQWNRKINAFFIGLLIIISIGFSRIYLGMHYISDVWGGFLLGLIWLIIAIGLAEYFLYKNNERNRKNDQVF